MRIVLDAIGGDHAPAEPVKGAIDAAREFGDQIILVGPVATLRAELARHNTRGVDLAVIDAPELIGMDESPVMAVRRKTRSSHVVGLRMVRSGDADAFVSPGHSGATMAGATLILGRAPGIERPALGGLFPSLVGKPVLVLDIGANTDCKPEYLYQFAHMGALYMERAMGIERPRVALLANGEEEGKGDRLVQESYELLKLSALNFVGNAEPKDALIYHSCDVLVADGFVGNLILKTSEAIVKLAFEKIKIEARANFWRRLIPGLVPATILSTVPGRGKWRAPAGAILGAGSLLATLVGVPMLKVSALLDYRTRGGVPLLGVRGVAVIAHGKSDAVAIKNAIGAARHAVESRAVTDIAEMVSGDAQLLRVPEL